MKISVSIGEQAVKAFERAIEDGVVTGISLDGYTLTFDYTGLEPNAALQRAVGNQQAAQAKSAELAEDGDEEGSQLYGYAAGFIATGATKLVQEQEAQGQQPIDPLAPENQLTTLGAAPSPAPKRRARSQDADATSA